MRKLRSYDILEYLKKRKRCTLAELMEKFGVSSATIHRDVAELESRNAVERVRGGIVFADAPAAKPGSGDYQDRVITNSAAKERIARKALKLVAEGDILFLDSSTTVYSFAQLLRQQSYSMLRVGAYSSVAVHWLPSILEEYKLMSPEYNTSISMNDIRQTYDAVKNDQLDVAFVSYQEGLMSGLEWIPLRDDELLAVLPGKYSREEGSFPVEFFSGLDFLMPKGGFDMDIMPIFAGLPQEKLPQFRYTNMDDAAIVSMAAHGLGVSVLSELVLQDMKDSTAIVPLSPPGYRRLGIIYKSRSGSDRTIRRFISCAQDVLRKMYGDA